jgi:Spy/CpxP family protein refolding chaperone
MNLRTLAAALLLALAATAAVAAPKVDGPQWASLTADQQQILAPLAADWDQGLSREQKQKWIGITKRYPSMKPESQKRVQGRMQKWAKLTPAQRAQAREQYRSLGKVAPDQQRDELRRYWAAYQALPREEKRMFDVPPSYVPPKERRKRASTAKTKQTSRYVLPAPL